MTVTDKARTAAYAVKQFLLAIQDNIEAHDDPCTVHEALCDAVEDLMVPLAGLGEEDTEAFKDIVDQIADYTEVAIEDVEEDNHKE